MSNKGDKHAAAKMDVAEVVAVISTAHITAQDAALLAKEYGEITIVPFPVYDMGGGSGYMFWVPTSQFDLFSNKQEPGLHAYELCQAGFSEALIGILRWAYEQGFGYVWLDRDAPLAECLPTYDW